MKLHLPTLLLALLLLLSCEKNPAETAAETAAPQSIRLDDTGMRTLDAENPVTIDFSVEPAEALFDRKIGSPACQLSLRLADDLRHAPADFSITRVSDGRTAGRYRAVIEAAGTNANFRREVCLALKLPSGELLVSQPVTIQGSGYHAGITGMRFRKEHNPSLGADVELTFDSRTATFSGRIPDYQPSMRLVATFDYDGTDRVEVGGQLQTSGRSVNDFSRDVIYTVRSQAHESRFTVSVTNFTGLPVVLIETPGRVPVTSKEEWIQEATIRIDGAGRFDDLDEVYTSIRGRGNSTWGWPKKPYNLKLAAKQPILGMPKHKRWCLLANYMDRTLLRNRTAYYLASQTSLAWTPRCEFVELFLNGAYQGQYLLAEHVKVDKNRVNITEMGPQDTAGEALTGGYLLELDFHFDNVWQWHTPHNVPFAVKSPDDDELVPVQFEWIRNHIAEVERCLYSIDFADPTTGYRRYLDAESFVDYWLVYELTVNHELANPGSVFLHKDRGGKIVAGPVWDFDWGTFSYNVSAGAQWGLFIQWAWWYGRLFEDLAFRTLAAERWRVLKPKFLTALDYIDGQQEYIAQSAAANFAIWRMTTDINGDERLSFEAAVARLRKILSERIEVIDREVSKW